MNLLTLNDFVEKENRIRLNSFGPIICINVILRDFLVVFNL